MPRRVSFPNFSRVVLTLLVLVACALFLSASAAAPSGVIWPSRAFFAFDNGVGRDKWPPAEQARVLKELGYAGISYNETTDITNRFQAFQSQGLKIFALYVHGYPDKPVRYEPGLTNAIRFLKGTDTIIWLTLREMPGNRDAAAVELVREVAALAAPAGLRVALYPHKGFYLQTAEQALQIADLAGCTNVGITLNLCHELTSGNGQRLGEIVRRCASRLFLVSINGADPGTTNQQTIKVLGEGSVDVLGFVRMLDQAGYRGPVGLQCFAVKGDQRENLKRSMSVWRGWTADAGGNDFQNQAERSSLTTTNL